MDLDVFIKQVGDEEAAKLFEVPLRTVLSWRYLDRRPRRSIAKIIVARSPVTYEGIYGKEKRGAP